MSCARFVRYPKKQSGGAASDWGASRNNVSIANDQLSEYTLEHIDNSPMFHPLEPNREFPTPTTGVYPQGIYYMNQLMKSECSKMAGCTQPGVVQRTVTVPTTGKERLVSELKKAMQ